MHINDGLAGPLRIDSVGDNGNILFHDMDVNRLLLEINGESDRSAVLIAAAFFEDTLEKRLRFVLRQASSNLLGRLMRRDGPLGPFSVKIDFLHGLGDIPPDLAEQLHALRKIRNQCAHSWNRFDISLSNLSRLLSDEKMSNIIGVLEAEYESVSGGHTITLSNRARFEIATAFLVLRCNTFFQKDGS